MFAGLDDRLHRHRSGAQRADAPAADFAAQCGAKEFPVTPAAHAQFRVALPPRRTLRTALLGCAAKSRRSGKVGNPFLGPYSSTKYSWRRHWKEKWHDRRSVRQLGGSSAGQGEYVGAMVPTYSRRPWRSRRVIRKSPIFSMRKSRKPRRMVLTYSGLLRPKVRIVMRKSDCSR
jgi:hypothetical protein